MGDCQQCLSNDTRPMTFSIDSESFMARDITENRLAHRSDELGVVDTTLDFIDDLEHDAAAVVQVATVFVGPTIKVLVRWASCTLLVPK